MAFTFNWAGIRPSSVQVSDRSQQTRSDAVAWGNALRGLERRQADSEYADMLKEYKPYDEAGVNNELKQLTAELARLKQRNAEIEAQLGG